MTGLLSSISVGHPHSEYRIVTNATVHFPVKQSVINCGFANDWREIPSNCRSDLWGHIEPQQQGACFLFFFSRFKLENDNTA